MQKTPTTTAVTSWRWPRARNINERALCRLVGRGLAPADSRCGGCATCGFPPSRDTNSRALPVLVCIPRSGPSALLRTPPRYDSRCGTLAAGSLSPATAPTNIRGCAPPWFAGIRSGLSSPAHDASALCDSRCGCSRRGHKPLRLRANPVRPLAVPGLCPSAPGLMPLLTTPPRYRQTPIYQIL